MLREPTKVTVRAEELGIAAAAAVRSPALSVDSLYREHFDFVWRNARRLGAGEDWVDDASHEVFLIAARRLAEFEGRSNPRTWLFAITLRVVQRMRRNRARYASRIERYRHELAPEASVDPQRQSDAAAYLRDLLARLPDDRRAVVILAELEGMTSAEIAEALGWKQGTVDTRLRAARIALAAMIDKDRARDERTKP